LNEDIKPFKSYRRRGNEK